jgi:hypothetical protein
VRRYFVQIVRSLCGSLCRTLCTPRRALMSTEVVVNIPLPDGRWIALGRDGFEQALAGRAFTLRDACALTDRRRRATHECRPARRRAQPPADVDRDRNPAR